MSLEDVPDSSIIPDDSDEEESVTIDWTSTPKSNLDCKAPPLLAQILHKPPPTCGLKKLLR